MKTMLSAVLAAAFALSAPAMAPEHQIQMLNKGDKGSMVFQPAAMNGQRFEVRFEERILRGSKKESDDIILPIILLTQEVF